MDTDDKLAIELKHRLELYRSHSSLIIKGAAIYLTIAGISATLIFDKPSLQDQDIALLVFVFSMTVLAGIASSIAFHWMIKNQKRVDAIGSELGLNVTGLAGGLYLLLVAFLGIIFVLVSFIILATIQSN